MLSLFVPTAVMVVFVTLVIMIVMALQKPTLKERFRVIKAVYYYAISFITLIMVIGGGISLFMAASDYIVPGTSAQNFEEYKASLIKYDANGKEIQSALTEDQLQQKYNDYVALEKQKVSDNGLNNLIQSLGWIIIPGPIFLYTQRRIKEFKVEAA